MPDSITGTLTGGLIDPASPDYGRIAAKNERKRRGIINLGLQQIGALFGGGTAPFYSLAGTEPFSRAEWRGATPEQKTFYSINARGNFAPYYAARRPASGTQEGAVEGAKYGSIVPGLGTIVGSTTGGIVGGLSSGDYMGAGLAAASGGGLPLAQSLFGGGTPSVREIVNKRLKRGLLFNAPTQQTFEGFQPSFYQQRAQDYINYALPQVADQYRTNRNAMLYGLSNRGLSGSSVAGQAGANLERTAGQARQTVADTGLAQANQLRQDVENARQEAIRQLYQSADPAQAFNAALGTTANLRQPSTFAPVANMFANLANQYYTNQVLNNYRQPAYGLPYTQQGSLAGSLGPNVYGYGA